MQRELAVRTENNFKSKSLDPIIGTSTYVVNNSLHCSVQHKRTSFDVKLYMQLHRKLLRKAIIEKKFQESLYYFSRGNKNSRKGFKGKTLSDHFIHNSVTNRQKRTLTETNLKMHQQTNHLYSTHTTFEQTNEETKRGSGAQSSHSKPNMMYNLSLYRKSYKRHDLKFQRMYTGDKQHLSIARENINSGAHQRKSKKMITIL